MPEKINPIEKAHKLAIKFCTPFDSVVPNRHSIQNAIKCVEELLVENNIFESENDILLSQKLSSRYLFLQEVAKELNRMLVMS